jgi:hypothetical protein
MTVAISYKIYASEAQVGLARMKELRGFKQGMVTAGGYLLGLQAYYPPESHRPQPFTSAKQRRAFFAKLRAGTIKVPYPRSYELQRSFGMVVRDEGLTIWTGTNNLTEGTWTHSERQSLYHRITGWRQVATIGQAASGDVYTIVYNAARMDFET